MTFPKPTSPNSSAPSVKPLQTIPSKPKPKKLTSGLNSTPKPKPIAHYDEFAQLPSKSSLYASIDELLVNYLTILESRHQLTSEDEELIMNLSAAYLKKQQEWKQEGRQETLTEVAINMLQQDFASDIIAKATGLSVRKINQLRKTIEPSPSTSIYVGK
jgi:hypothetical protein